MRLKGASESEADAPKSAVAAQSKGARSMSAVTARSARSMSVQGHAGSGQSKGTGSTSVQGHAVHIRLTLLETGSTVQAIRGLA